MRAGTTAAMLNAIPHLRLGGQQPSSTDSIILDEFAHLADPNEMRSLALRAVDAARSAGAIYADVRLTRTVNQAFEHPQQRVLRASVTDSEMLGVGVRALINGYWGFAASPYWESEEVTNLAKEAVNQAKANTIESSRTLVWESLPASTGSWITPGIDPFAIPIDEKIDFMNAWRRAILETHIPGYTLALRDSKMKFNRQEWFMASTDGTAIAQVFYSTEGEYPFVLQPKDWRIASQKGGSGATADNLFKQRGGWDIILDANVLDQIPTMAEKAIAMYGLNPGPVDIGRYDVVFDAAATASLLAQTFGLATQLDRAMGFEANGVGSSYLGPDPMEFLGSNVAAAPLINISANRSMPKGMATVKWDDEGVLPDEFSLVKDGLLVDFQTTREQALWMKPWYQKQRRTIGSHGCASAPSAVSLPLQHPPNLSLQPDTSSTTFESMISGIKRGYAIAGAEISTDFQAKNGMGTNGFVREIVNGELGNVIQHSGFLFNAVDFWKNVTAIGGSSSVKVAPKTNVKGQPMQASDYSVSAVPLTVKDVSIVDSRRRA